MVQCSTWLLWVLGGVYDGALLCCNPDEKQRMQMSRDLGLEPK